MNQGSNSFVLCVLDGDGAVFQDYLFAMGKDGGSDAAHQLHVEIKNYLKSTYPNGSVDDWNIVVQVVLNLQGLTNKLLACGIVTNPNEVYAFARAFALAQPLFSFIDVGVGKERAVRITNGQKWRLRSLSYAGLSFLTPSPPHKASTNHPFLSLGPQDTRDTKSVPPECTMQACILRTMQRQRLRSRLGELQTRLCISVNVDRNPYLRARLR